MENEFAVQDLISLSYDQKPIEFQQAFNSLIAGRIADAVNNKKMEVAASLYAQPEDETVVDAEQELDTQEQDQEENTDGEAA
jgi:hypothetical protein